MAKVAVLAPENGRTPFLQREIGQQWITFSEHLLQLVPSERPLDIFSLLILTKTPWHRYFYCPHFIDVETGAHSNVQLNARVSSNVSSLDFAYHPLESEKKVKPLWLLCTSVCLAFPLHWKNKTWSCPRGKTFLILVGPWNSWLEPIWLCQQAGTRPWSHMNVTCSSDQPSQYVQDGEVSFNAGFLGKLGESVTLNGQEQSSGGSCFIMMHLWATNSHHREYEEMMSSGRSEPG